MLDGLGFEKVVAEIYRDNGYEADVTKASGDFGVDVIAVKDGIRYAIQCKYYSSKLNGKPIQEVVAGAVKWGCQRYVVVTNNEFTNPAKELAVANGVQLVDGEMLKMMDFKNRLETAESGGYPQSSNENNEDSPYNPSGQGDFSQQRTNRNSGEELTGLPAFIYKWTGLNTGTNIWMNLIVLILLLFISPFILVWKWNGMQPLLKVVWTVTLLGVYYMLIIRHIIEKFNWTWSFGL